MKDNWITVATFDQTIQAHLAKSKLESEGIQCELLNESVINMNWLYPPVLGRVKLRVSKEHFGDAIKILNRVSLPVDWEEQVYSEYIPNCPKCASIEVCVEKKEPRGKLWKWLKTIFPKSFEQRNWLCRKCGKIWKTPVV